MTKERGRAATPPQKGSSTGKAPPKTAKAKPSAARTKSSSSSRAVKSAAPRAVVKPEPAVTDAASPPPLLNDAEAELPPRDTDPQGWLDALIARWTRRGQMLLQKLAEHGAAEHEYRADLKEGRFVWIAPDGHVSVEARANVLCSWSRSTSVLAMAWADPVVRYAGVTELPGLASEHDDVDEEKAWLLAMEAAEAAGAEYLYRVPSPHAWYFLALRDLTFDPKRASFRPGTPVGLVLRELADTRAAIESRAEPTQVIRKRLSSLGSSLLHQAGYAYRGTDWVARLERTGNRLTQLASRLPRQSFGSIAAGQPTEEWIERDVAVDLIQSISLLEDEWNMFA